MKMGFYWDLRSTFPERHTGVGKHVIQILRHLAAAEHAVVILLASDQVALWAEQAPAHGLDSIPTRRLPLTNKGFRFWHGISPLPSVQKWIADLDIVYSPMELLLRTGSIPFINTIHGCPFFEAEVPDSIYNSRLYRLERLKQRWFLWRSRSCARQSCVVSAYLARRIHEIADIPLSALPVVGNGVEPCFFENQPLSEARHPVKETRLLAVGGANLFDGAPHLLRFAELLGKARPEVRIRLIGDRHEAPWEASLRRCHNVDWLGFLETKEVCAEMQAATALLYLPAVESFGIIGAEAMAAGLPILAQRSTALPEVIGEAALWVDPTASDAELLTSLDRIIDDAELRRSLIKAGHARARRYKWSAVGERVGAILSSKLSRS